ncbi:hypothetical protein [Aestuariirhabdus sp. LZHN29]|uniref:hypothetical protein n=1 Tax=Aestuariirhabdus sp. LZHN29 TaxID=3417462 RepID=UPI003CF78810
MKTAKYCIAFGGLMLISTMASAAFDGKKELVCATQAVNECVMGQGCASVAPSLVNIPDFFIVDGAGKTIQGAERKTPIERSEILDGKLILQGAEDGVETVRDGLGWTMVIEQDSGKMSLTGAGDGFAIVLFGACMER